MTFRSALAICLLLVSAASAHAQSASSWFLAEGASNALFTQEILVANPNAAAITVTVTLLPEPGAVTSGAITSKSYAMAVTSRLTVNLKAEFPNLNGAASARVSAVLASDGSTPADIVVERSMYFPDATRAGGHNASGVTAPAERWILAEGATTIFDTFILVTNPNAAATTVRITYLRGGGVPAITDTRSVGANSRLTLWPAQEHQALASAEFSTVVESLSSGSPIVAERAMYFDYPNAQSFARSGHDALGVPAPSTTWYFAEGNTSGNAAIAFETFLLLANQNETPTEVTVTYQLDTGEALSRVYAVPARSRFTVWVDQEGRLFDSKLLNAAFGISVLATQPIVAERAMYWGTPSARDVTTPTVPWREGHATAGATARASTWGFAEGAQDYVDTSGTRYQTFLLYANPNPTPIAVRATFLRDDGTGIQRLRCVPGNGRANVWTADFPELSNRRFATFVQTVATAPGAVCPGVATTGGEQFVAERAMYWGDGFSGGHVNIGTPWTGTITAPPAPDFTLTATLLGPTTGRLSGGEWVTLDVRNVAPADIRVTFGGRPAAAVQFGPGLNQIRAMTPVRTEATGYGSAGPATVQVQSLGRTANAGSFTFTFNVLVFGDSITWGTFNIYVPDTGQKISTQVNGPYPLVLKNLLSGNSRFGAYTRVTNAGVPGEQARGQGEARMPRCLSTGPLTTCGYDKGGIVPGDFMRPFDVVILLEGINDLIGGGTPERARDALRAMILTAKSSNVRVILGRFDSFKTNQETGYWTGLDESKQLATLTEALAVEQGLPRIRFDEISMSWDGLHPDQIGYNKMGALAYDKILEGFRP